MVVQYGVDVIVPEHARLEIPLHHSRELCARPGGLAIRQLPEFIQFQYDTIRQEQAQEIEHFSVEEQHVFGSHLVPCLHLEYLTADPYQGLADTIHQIGKPYCDWRLEIGDWRTTWCSRTWFSRWGWTQETARCIDAQGPGSYKKRALFTTPKIRCALLESSIRKIQ